VDFELTERDIARFRSKLRRASVTGCLVFNGAKFPKGHGAFRLPKKGGKQRLVRAHHVALAVAGRSIPAGHDAMHNCPGGDNPACCEPAHLTTGIPKEHGRDRSIKAQRRKSRSGLPFGAVRQRNGRYGSQAWLGDRTVCFGTYDTWAEASALALFHKNSYLFPDPEVN